MNHTMRRTLIPYKLSEAFKFIEGQSSSLRHYLTFIPQSANVELVFNGRPI